MLSVNLNSKRFIQHPIRRKQNSTCRIIMYKTVVFSWRAYVSVGPGSVSVKFKRMGANSSKPFLSCSAYIVL